MARVLKFEQKFLDAYLDHLKADYAAWGGNRANETETQKRVRAEMIEDYNKNLHYEVGNKYVKIINGAHGQRSVHSFIVNSDNDKKFQLGDVLKAAGWAAPARNKARGNIIAGNHAASWTGAHYL